MKYSMESLDYAEDIKWLAVISLLLLNFVIIAVIKREQTISQQQVTITGLESALEANKYHLQECLKDARVGYSEFTGE